MGDILNSIFFFVIALGVLISIHEYGHFWVARRCGVKVLKFSIGFGRPLWRKTGADGVEYVLAMIPLGGYVKMLDEAEGDVRPEERAQAFNCQPLWKRFLIVLAGPVANFLLAIFLYSAVYIVGDNGLKPIIGKITPNSLAEQSGLRVNDEIMAIDDAPTLSWQAAMFALLDKQMDKEVAEVRVRDKAGIETLKLVDFSQPMSTNEGTIDVLKQLGVAPYYPKIPAIVGVIEDGKAASRAGLQTGDEIKSINGERVIDWVDWVSKIRAHPDQTLMVEVERERVSYVLALTPDKIERKTGTIGYVGVGPDIQAIDALMHEFRVKVRYTPPLAVWQATKKTWDMSLLTLQVLGKILTGEAAMSNLSGPISIAQYAGDTANAGIVTFLMFLAVISVSLGVLNLLPIPLLDGGHLFYYCIEFFRGKPVPEWVQAIGLKVGIFILACLMSIAFYNDILRLLGEG